MGLDKIIKHPYNVGRYNALMRILHTINDKSNILDLTKLITSFQTYKRFTPKQSVWLFNIGRKWFYSENELNMKGFVNINLNTSRDNILHLSDEDFEVLEKHLTEEQRIRVYNWKCVEFGL